MKNIKKLLAQQKSEILPDDKIKDNIKKELGKYNFVMTISLPNVAGTSTYKLYYDEIATETNTRIGR